MLVLGYLAYGLVYLGFAVAKSPSAMWWLFAVYGLYIGFTEGVEKALVADIAPPEQKATLIGLHAIGLHATIVGIGLLPASTLAGFLWDTSGSQAPFYFGGVADMLASLGMRWILRPGIADPEN